MSFRAFITIIIILITGYSFRADAQRLFGKDIPVDACDYGPDSVSALADAKRSAVEMAYKTLISSRTQVENDKVSTDVVVAHSYGMIKKWSIIENNATDSITTIRINAVVYFSDFLGGKEKVKSKIKVKKSFK